jgi:hypothetical protein
MFLHPTEEKIIFVHLAQAMETKFTLLALLHVL